MIKLSSFLPEYFDNNGDQGNIAVLAHTLGNSGIDFQIDSSIAADSSFVLVGDASFAAMREFKPQLQTILTHLEHRLQDGLPTLLVGSSYEYFAPLLGIEIVKGERVSAFVREETSLGSVFGYHNSTVTNGRFFSKGGFIGTTMFGPILAKNPKLITHVLGAMGLKIDLEDWQSQYPMEIESRTTFG